MSNDLTELRRRIVAHLRSKGFEAFEVMPNPAPVPCVWVNPDDPYLSRDGASFGGLIVRHQVNFAAAAGTSDTTAEALDEMTLMVLDALDDFEDSVTGEVGRVGLAPLNNQQYLAAGIDLRTEIQRSRP